MEREISSGAMLGVVLLSLAAVIGLGFGVFAIAKSVANDGTVNMQDSLATVSDQAFLDYDQKVVTGTQALAALNTFEGKPYAILYSTRAINGGGSVHPEHTSVQTFGGTIEDGKAELASGNDIMYINYNALIDTDYNVKATVVDENGDEEEVETVLLYTNGSFVINRLKSRNGEIQYDNVTVGLYKQGNAEYISSSSKFSANVIKDEGGNYIGVVFEEM